MVIERVLRSVSLLMARIGGGLLLAAAILIAVEVAVRYLRIASFSVGTELSSYALAVGASWSLAFVVFERAHVRIDVVPQRLPLRPKAILDILGMASLAAVGVVLAAGGWEMFLTSVGLWARANTTLGTPLAYPQGAWTFGLVWFTAIAFYRMTVAGVAFMKLNFAAVSAVAGSPSTDEEVEGAISETKQLLEKDAA